MTTYFIDYEGGNDANTGVSFAQRVKTFGATALAAMTGGDTARVMGSPAATSIGNATWTDGPLQATQSIVSSTNATPIVVTVTAHGYSNGDTIQLAAHTTNTKANGTWEIANVAANTFELVGSVGNGVGGAAGTVRNINNCRVVLAGALTKTIAVVGNQGQTTNWTPSANVTATITTADFKQGGECQSLAVAAGFTTGLAAYLTLGLNTDFSAYNQVSFWIKQTVGTIGAASSISLKICTDTVGAVGANTINIPLIGALNNWQCITVDTGGALSALANSIAFYVNTDNAAQTFLIDDIVACKDSTVASALSITSLMGKNSGVEAWWGIQSINDTRVVLDSSPATLPTSTTRRGYTGTSQTVTTYKQETTKIAAGAVVGTVSNAVQASGSAGNLINFSGGWDRTNMSTQNITTWWDVTNGLGIGIDLNAKSYVYLDKINMARFDSGVRSVSAGATGCQIGNMSFANLGSVPIVLSTSTGTVYSGTLTFSALAGSSGVTPVAGDRFTTIYGYGNTGTILSGVAGVYYGAITSLNNNGAGAQVGVNSYILTGVSSQNLSNGLSIGARSTIGSWTATNNTGYGVVAAEGLTVLGGSTSGNSSGGVNITSAVSYFNNFTINEATEVAGFTAFSDSRVYSQNHDNTYGNQQIFCDGGLINTTTGASVPAGAVWAMMPTSTNRTVNYPLNLSLAKIAVNASSLVTVSVPMARTNTGLTMSLTCKGGQLAGIPSDVTSSMTASANTSETLTITFTPSAAGVVEIIAQAYGGTTYTGWIYGPITITQA